MAPQRIRQIKREIRVLGVAARRDPDGYTVVGVVYRGSLWLDGVLRGHTDSNLTQAIAGMINDSPQSGQIRVILLSRANLATDTMVHTAELYAETGKPVILLGDTEGEFTWGNDGEKVPFSVEGLGRWSAEGVLKASTREGANPEALRVAALTLSALPNGIDA